jgi:hypothetical protein
VVADYAEVGEVVGGDGAAAVVGEALVALGGVLLGVWDGWRGVEAYFDVVVPVCLHGCCVGVCGGMGRRKRR